MFSFFFADFEYTEFPAVGRGSAAFSGPPPTRWVKS